MSSGSGTDPLEGSSLAISLLEHFHTINALTICTTHYHELKNYALVTDGFENASSDFDVENLRPTYRLLIGVPGKSNAFAISKKLGLNDEILHRAQDFLKADDINIETLLKNIYDDKLEIEKQKEIYQKNVNQIELLKKSLERDNSKLNEEAKNIIENAKIKAREILLDAKEEANEIIKELNSKNINSKEANKMRDKLNTSIETLSLSNNSDVTKQNILDNIYVGQEVLVNKLNQQAIIQTLPNKSNEVKVQIGSLTMNVNLEDLSPIDNAKTKSIIKSKSSVTFSNNLKSQNVASEINVIGLNVDQALPIVDKYLDDCYMANLEFARIVHGKGTGKLREGIHSFLKKNPHVKSFRLGTFGEGEMGVTIVYFK